MLFTISATSGVAQTLDIVLKGYLSNGKTTDQIEFKVEYIIAESPWYFIEEDEPGS